MSKVAIVEKISSRTDYSNWFPFEFDKLALSSKTSGKVLKADITLDIPAVKEKYDYIILVGAECCKFVGGIGSVSTYQGYLVEGKYLPLINPSMLTFKPEFKDYYQKAVERINNYVAGVSAEIEELTLHGIQNTEEAQVFLSRVLKSKTEYVFLDTETSGLYPRDGHVLGISISWGDQEAAYIDSACIDEKCEKLLQQICNYKVVVFHNAKFDIAMLSYHFGIKFKKNIEDTILLHYVLDENSSHSLKELTLKYFPELGDYDRPLEEFKRKYCKDHDVKIKQFSYEVIPFEIMYKYAATDVIATARLFYKFQGAILKNPKLNKVYRNILVPATRLLQKVEGNGVPFSKVTLEQIFKEIDDELTELKKELYSYKEIKELEEVQLAPFNPNSVPQLRNLFFKRLGLAHTGILTDKGEASTNAEALGILSKQHPVPAIIHKIRKLTKIQSTYIIKILANLDMDERLRTSFNLIFTTSGRLSSSGKLNMQQLPRDDKRVKRCIQARPGFVITSQDLSTAEMYVAAILSKDKKLMNVFQQKGDFHSTIGKMAFNLLCDVEDVKAQFPDARQASKGLSFGILYGAGPDKVANIAGCSIEEARNLIKWYFQEFKQLDRWLKENQKFIRQNAFIYSALGRKRRLPNTRSENKSIVGHEVRSGINFLVQSVASDINLVAAIKVQDWIEEQGYEEDIKIFGLVHDSILAEVKEELVDIYQAKLKEFTQEDIGVSIPGCPIGVDFEKGDTYAF